MVHRSGTGGQATKVRNGFCVLPNHGAEDFRGRVEEGRLGGNDLQAKMKVCKLQGAVVVRE
jgi:hypothetical protein